MPRPYHTVKAKKGMAARQYADLLEEVARHG